MEQQKKKNVVDAADVPAIAAEGIQSAAIVDTAAMAQLNMLMKVSGELHKSGMFPQLANSGQVLAVVLAGHERGYPAMTSLMNIHIINGRPGYSAQMVAAELEKGAVTFDVLETTPEKCRIRFTKPGKKPFEYEWTVQDAMRAKKLPAKESSVWNLYPQDMLYARCLTAGGRKFAPAAIQGVYLADEMTLKIADDPTTPATQSPPDPTLSKTERLKQEIAPKPEPEAAPIPEPEPEPEPAKKRNTKPKKKAYQTMADYELCSNILAQISPDFVVQMETVKGLTDNEYESVIDIPVDKIAEFHAKLKEKYRKEAEA